MVREMGEGFKREGTNVYLWLIHVDIWQNQYNIVKLKNKIKKIRKKKKKTNVMASGPITSWEIRKYWKQCQTLFFWAPKSPQMVTAAMKLKDTCSLEKKQ